MKTNRRVLAASLLVASSALAQDRSVERKPAGASTIAPRAPSTAADDPWSGRTDLFVAPTTHTSTKVELGDVERFTLPNGLRVIAVARHAAPVVDVTVAIAIDDAAEPLDKSGIATFVATMLHKGTTKRSSDQLAELIDGAGAELEASTSESGVLVSCRGRSRDLPLCLDVSSDVLLRPAFSAKEMDEIRSQLIASVEQTRDTPAALAQEHATNLYFGDDDPRGRPLSTRTVKNIDHDSIVAFYKTWFVPNHAILAVSGDFDPKRIRAQLTRWFGGWKSGETPKLTARPLPPAGPMKVRLVDKPDSTQAQIVIVGPGIAHADPSLCAVRLMNYTLGEGAFSSRLMKVVRSENAKTYGASSHFSTHREPGTFEASTFTREPETASTIKLVLGEIDKMKRGGPSAAELAAAKANLVGGYGLHFETASDVAHQLVVAAEDELPVDFAQTYPACLDRVTLTQAAQAASAHLAPQALVVVGNAAKLGPLLTAAKLAPTETVSYTDAISRAERTQAVSAKLAGKTAVSNATPTEREEGQKILKLALAAKGADSIARITDLQVAGTGTMSMRGQKVKVSFAGWYAPAKQSQREDLSVGGMSMSQVLSGGSKAFSKNGDRLSDLPADQLTALRRELWRNGNLVVLNAAAQGVEVRALPPTMDGKNRFDALNVVTLEGESVELELDQKTHQLAKVAWMDDGQKVSLALSDYRSEDGIQCAHHLVLVTNEQRIDVALDKIQINQGLPPGVFSK